MLGLDVREIGVVITGASGGIGMAFAKAFLEGGARVSNWDIKKNGEVDELLASYADSYQFLETDITNESSIESAVLATVEAFGRIDVLVNMAGIIAKAEVDKLEKEVLDRLYEVNVCGLMLVTKHVVPYLKKSGRGRIINISSMQAALGMETYTPYTFTKAAVSGITRVWALELAPYGITVNAICPGWTYSPMTKPSNTKLAQLHGVSYEEAWEMKLSYIPQHRYIDAKELAFLGLFLASPLSQAISANEIFADTGMVHCTKPGLHMVTPKVNQ